MDQAEAATAFSWRRLTVSKTERWVQGKNFELLVASHDGYQRLPQPVTHQRWVISLRDGIYLIRDVVFGEGTHCLDIAWHLGPSLQFVEERTFRRKDAAYGLSLIPAHGHGWAEQVSRESWSPVYGQRSPMTVMNFSTTTSLPAQFALLLVTWEEGHRPSSSLASIGDVQGSGARGYRYSGSGVEYVFIFGEAGKPWCVGDLRGDAVFACRKRNSGGAAEHLMLAGGSYVRVEAGTELRCAHKVDWAELIVGESGRTVFSSDTTALEG